MSLHRNPAAREASKRIASDIADFLAAGNSIYQCTEDDNEYARFQRKRQKRANKMKPNPFRVFSVQQVREIRSVDWQSLSTAEYNIKVREFAKRFRSADPSIRRVILGETYKEIA